MAKKTRVIPEGLSAYEWAIRQNPVLSEKGATPGALQNWIVGNIKPGRSNFYAWLDGSRELPPEHIMAYLNALAPIIETPASTAKGSGEKDELKDRRSLSRDQQPAPHSAKQSAASSKKRKRTG